MTEVPPIRSIVELRPGCEDFYNGAQAGWRGLVLDRKVDDGFDLIYVAWDRDHWRYDPAVDQANGWTYPAHFDVVGHLGQTAEEFAAEMVGVHDVRKQNEPEGEACKNCGETHSDEDTQAAYLDSLSRAANKAALGEGYALFYVTREREGDEVVIRPQMISACITDEATALVEAQILRVAEDIAHKYMIEYLKRFT